jgi:uncharacterized protein (DUF1800 family)
MNLENVFHLYSRFGFGIDYNSASKLINDFKAQDQLFSSLKTNELIHEDLPSMETIKEWKSKKGTDAKKFRKKLNKLIKEKDAEINQVWIEKMASTDQVLVEKMTLFWHGHFACQTKNPFMQIDLNNILRRNSLGNFRDLLLSVSQSGAMIDYLHLKQNKKGLPNEDFARELCELFTLGRDVLYTEQDVTEIARAFTGWGRNFEGKFIYNSKKHDDGSKTIFGKTKNFTGEEVLDLILSKKECATFISSKLYSYFVNPKINHHHLKELSDVLFNSNYDLAKTMRHIADSSWFYDKENVGVKIKSPIELLIGMMRSFQLKSNDPKPYIILQRVLEQHLFHPPNVAGWPGDQHWIDSARLSIRLRLASKVLNGGSLNIDPKPDNDAKPMENTAGMGKKTSLSYNWNYYFKNNPNTIDHVQVLLRSPMISETKKKLETAHFNSCEEKVIQIMSLPEYQMC